MYRLKKLAQTDISVIEKRIILWLVAFTIAFIANTAHNMDKAIVSLQVETKQNCTIIAAHDKQIHELKEESINCINAIQFLKNRVNNSNERILDIEKELEW